MFMIRASPLRGVVPHGLDCRMRCNTIADWADPAETVDRIAERRTRPTVRDPAR
jgi:hypothetical protein